MHSMTSIIESPQARLVASRKALVRQMGRQDGRTDNEMPDGLHGSSGGQADDAQRSPARHSTWQVFSQALLAWWQHHPVQVAVDIGRPFLNNYARSRPLQLVGIAAGVGAALVLVKPWRLVSITGLAVAALKSTKLSSSLLSLLPRAAPNAHDQQTQKTLKDTL